MPKAPIDSADMNETETQEQFTNDIESLLPFDEHEEIVSEGGKKVRRRGIYILPNLMTLGAMFAGFYAVIAGMAGNFNEAGWAILIAGILDGLDGRIARLTNTQSAFGAQFDSLSDMISFGMAPALIVFSWALAPLDNIGWAASFIYMSCAALRLARFNVQLGSASKNYFLGLQSPLAAGLVTFVPWVCFKYSVEVTPFIAYLTAGLTVFAGLLMISNYQYFSFKEIHFKGTVPYLVFVLAIVLLGVVALNPHEVLLGMCVVYVLSGPVMWVYQRGWQKVPASKKAEKTPVALNSASVQKPAKTAKSSAVKQKPGKPAAKTKQTPPKPKT